MDLNPTDHRCVASFFEVRSRGQRASGYLEKQVYQSTIAWLNGIATGAAWLVDPMHWYDIPGWSPIDFYYTDENYWAPAYAWEGAGYVPEEWELALEMMW
jgi:hypothetical protein